MSFPAKIMLFGEYTVILNSVALLMPFRELAGKLKFKKSSESIGANYNYSFRELRSFYKYLEKVIQEKEWPTNKYDFDLSRFEFDLEQGLFFDSNIKEGHGLGSSGALCAAIFDKYVISRSEIDLSQDLEDLKNCFKLLESNFHGKSSGMDPLICFINEPLFIDGKEQINVLQLDDHKISDLQVFILDTGRPRRTEPLVNLFLEKCKNNVFLDLLEQELIPITMKIIKAYIENQPKEVFKLWKQISNFQYKYFAPMIPKVLADEWIKGIESGEYLLKLCGAGGGGYMLGITKNFEKTKKMLQKFPLRKV